MRYNWVLVMIFYALGYDIDYGNEWAEKEIEKGRFCGICIQSWHRVYGCGTDALDKKSGPDVLSRSGLGMLVTFVLVSRFRCRCRWTAVG